MRLSGESKNFLDRTWDTLLMSQDKALDHLLNRYLDNKAEHFDGGLPGESTDKWMKKLPYTTEDDLIVRDFINELIESRKRQKKKKDHNN